MICIYHSKDLDGWMSAAIVNYMYPDVTLIGWTYGDPIPDLSLYDKVIMCDISFPVAEMDLIASRVDIIQRDFIWIDHHLSSIKECSFEIDGKYISGYGGIRDTNFAACELTWQFFFPDKQMPEIVRLLGRYDCFGHKGTDEEKMVLEFQYGARQYISNPEEALIYLNKCLEGDYSTNQVIYAIHQAGIAIYKYLCTEAKSIYQYKFDRDFDGYKFACVNRERFNPVNFGIDYHSDGYDGFASFYFNGKDWEWSLYNDNGKVDCSLIAKNRGGGGHKGAAGFRTIAVEQ